MKFKNGVKKGLKLLAVYFLAMLLVLMMAEKVERLNEIEKMEREANVAVKIDK